MLEQAATLLGQFTQSTRLLRLSTVLGSDVLLAAVYWINSAATAISRNILREADLGYSQAVCLQTARGTNGNVPASRVNGLDGRLQMFVFFKYALLDAVRQQNIEALTFAWRRNSEQTGTVRRSNGVEQRVYEDATHTINVNITPRRPAP